MKQLIIFAILMPAAVAAEMPKLPAALQQAVPPGWAATYYASGDLNGDQRADAALIIQQQNPALRLKNEGLGADVLDTNPRRLLVLVRENKGYRLLAQSPDSLLPPQASLEAPCLQDPLDEKAQDEAVIGIKRGRLWLNVSYWLSCGSYETQINRYQFRYQNGVMRLIGADGLSFSRASHDESYYSANFLNGKVKMVTGVNQSRAEHHRPRERWTQLAHTPETDLQRMQALPNLWKTEDD